MHDWSIWTLFHCKTTKDIRARTCFLLVMSGFELIKAMIQEFHFVLYHSMLAYAILHYATVFHTFLFLSSSISWSIAVSVSTSVSFIILLCYLRRSLGWKCTVRWHHISNSLISGRRRLRQWCVENLVGKKRKKKKRSKPGNMKKKYCIQAHFTCIIFTV